ncbi:MAG TPA: NADH-quinone oxidoreductase subunit J [Actinomycetota bacterium]|nr:NADH-quinone oxidoreductase subunit J [Actinomycetota bacterium]
MSADVWQQAVFWVLAVGMTFSALRVVTAQNVVHAALYLVGTLLGAAALYVLLFAEFVAWAQVLVYVGAIVVLMLFGLMLTQADIGKGNYDNNQRLLAAVCAAALFGVTSWVMFDTFEGQEISFERTQGVSTESVGEVIFAAYVLPFEIVSVLLLAALVGAVVIARRDVGDESSGEIRAETRARVPDLDRDAAERTPEVVR